MTNQILPLVATEVHGSAKPAMRNKKPPVLELPDQSRLHELFDYKSGQLVWRKRPLNSFANVRAAKCWNTKYVGTVAGRIHSISGYRVIRIDTVGFLAHRLVWVWHFGNFSSGMQIDHINSYKHDNRINNLRLATPSQNIHNTATRQDNTSGYKGVSRCDKTSKWIAKIGINGKSKILGRFTNIVDAASEYARAAESAVGAFTHLTVLKNKRTPVQLDLIDNASIGVA